MELIHAMIMLIVLALSIAGICQIVEWIMGWYDNRKNENKWIE